MSAFPAQHGRRRRRLVWGVGVIFADKVSGGGLWGDFLALITALSLAACSIIIRKNQDIAFVPGLIIGAVFIRTALFAVCRLDNG